MALEVMLCHRDGYCLARNNFRIYHNPDTCRLVFLPDGMDQLFGKADFPWKPSMAGLVAAAVMNTPEGQRRYTDRFAVLLNNVFKADSLTNRVNELVRELGPNLTRHEFRELARKAAVVKDRIAQRHLDLKWQLSQPELAPLDFADGVAHPSGWVKVDEPVGGRMELVRSPDGVQALRIVAGAATTASWRARVLLKNGYYRLEGRGKVVAVKPLPYGRHQGAGLRVSGRTRSAGNLLGNSSWRPLAVEFRIETGAEEIELICELRASAGEFWVDLGSLRVVRTDLVTNDGTACLR
jgi:hypothetical protein